MTISMPARHGILCLAALLLPGAIVPALAAGQSGSPEGEASRASYSLGDEALWRHETLSVEADLRLEDLAVGNDGTVWVSHSSGVLRYDGLEWQPVTVNGLAPRERLRRLVATETGLLASSRRHVFFGAAALAPLSLGDDFADATIMAAVPAPDSGIWIDVLRDDGTRELLHHLGSRVVTLPTPAPPDSSSAALWSGRSGTIWLSTREGLYSHGGDAWVPRLPVPDAPFVDLGALRENARGDGALEIRYPPSMAGVWVWREHGSLRRVSGLEEGFTRSLAVHESGEPLAIYTSQRAFWGEPDRTISGLPASVAAAKTLAFDGHSRVWALGQRSVSSFDPARRLWKRWPAPRRGVAGRIHAILDRADGSTWLATAGGVRVIEPDGTQQVIDEIDGDPLGVVTGLAEDTDGNIWISSGSDFRGVYRWDGTRWTFLGSPDPSAGAYFHRIVPDRTGALWVLGLQRTRSPGIDQDVGVWVVEDGRPRRWEHSDELPSGRVYDFVDGGDALWFGTRGGLARYRDGRWTRWGTDALRNTRIFAVAVDARGRTWFTDEQVGLGTMEPDDSVRYIGPAEGLPVEGVREILPDADGLWLAGDEGVGRFVDGVFAQPVVGAPEPLTESWPLLLRDNALLVGSQGLGVLELDLRAAARGTPVAMIDDVLSQPTEAIVHWRAHSPGAQIPQGLIHSRFRVDEGAWSEWTQRTEARLMSLSPGPHSVSVQTRGLLGELTSPVRATFEIPVPIVRDPRFYLPVAGLLVALLVVGGVAASRRSQQSRALWRSEASYRNLFESAGDAILTTDLEGNLTSMNRAGVVITGKRREELAHLSTESIMPVDSVRAFERALRSQLGGAEPTVYEAELIGADGSLVPVEVNSRLVREGGEVVGAQAFVRDIRERRHAEESLRNVAMAISAATGDDFFRSLVENLARELCTDFAFVAIPGEHPEAPPESLRTVAVWGDGQPMEPFEYELAGTPCSQALSQGLCAVTDGVQRAFPADKLLADMGIASYVGSPLLDSTGSRLGIIVVMDRQPLANERLARSMLQIFAIRAAAELDRMKSERALRKTEEELQQAQKMEAVGRLAGGIAHDFNNFLTVISGYAQLVGDALVSDSPVAEDVEQIGNAARSASRLTEQLLAFGRGQMLESTEVDPVEITQSVRSLLERLLGPRDDLVLDVKQGSRRVRLGRGQLEQILMNLVSNAVDATPDGGRIVVRWRVRSPADREPEVELQVQDDGVGMDDSTRQRAFDPFFTTKESGAGTGLGLSSVYGIVKHSGGTLKIESEPGTGTLVRITWPAADAHVVPDATDAGDRTLARVQEPSATILLVEDQDMVRSFVEKALERTGYRVIAVRSAAAALDVLAHEESIDLLLSDVVMPGMDGVELAHRVHEHHPATRILLMSGYTEERISAEGVDDLLAKPFTPGELRHRVRRVLAALD